MNRAMFSGVAGLKTHQTRMDVIGNNIANVNTYGYKTQRAVFSDIFYQTLYGASQGTATRGGTNPSTVGYGSSLGAIQTMMTQSSMQSTGFGLDVSITGEGFLQVMDADGNVFYTRAGLLDYDSNGYLVDINGNFVLGSADPTGSPASQRINIASAFGVVNEANPSATFAVNGITYTLEATSKSKDANVSVTVSYSDAVPIDWPADAIISETGSINVRLRSDAEFLTIGALNTAINDAVRRANGNKDHPAGTMTLTATDANNATVDPIKAAADKGEILTGKDIAGTNFAGTAGTVPLNYQGIKFETTSINFSGEGKVEDLKMSIMNLATPATPPDPDPDPKYSVQMEVTIGGVTYVSPYIEPDAVGSYLVLTNAGDPKDTFTVSFPKISGLVDLYEQEGGILPAAGGSDGPITTAFATTEEAKKAKASANLGLSADTFNLGGGTETYQVTLDQLTGIAIGADGTIFASHPDKGTMPVGKISLANFANPRGLMQVGTNYYSETVNSGKPSLCDPGTGGTGAIKSSTLEMSNVDLANEFADMIVTQRGFQANTRIVSVSDQMLEELVNLKR
ncbi:MAG: flagellar hook-basal body complex protein [Clostridiales bacterium]|nr:flagellar hook-basal body complex protein [Clostridiales bacterium]